MVNAHSALGSWDRVALKGPLQFWPSFLKRGTPSPTEEAQALTGLQLQEKTSPLTLQSLIFDMAGRKTEFLIDCIFVLYPDSASQC